MRKLIEKNRRNSKRFALILLMAILLLLGTSCGTPLVETKSSGKVANERGKQAEKTEVVLIACPIDGIQVNQEIARQRPIAVMVENLSTIRPQAGLEKACIVFEALAEGGITRFVAIYGHEDVTEIGPVRSARPYYVQIARGFDAIYAHAGGSKTGMETIGISGIADLDQFRYAKAYRRVSGIRMPHNLFTDTSKIREIAAEAGFKNSAVYEGFRHKADIPLNKRPQTQNISINFSSADYRVEYQYDRNSNSYLRFNGGKPHIDRISGKQIQPKNVLVVYAVTGGIPGEVGTLDIGVVGSGPVTVFQDGTTTKGIWKKASPKNQFDFFDGNGREIALNAGQTWVEIVKPDTAVTYESREQGEKTED